MPMQRVTSYLPAGTPNSHPIEQVKLPHDLRHLSSCCIWKAAVW